MTALDRLDIRQSGAGFPVLVLKKEKPLLQSRFYANQACRSGWRGSYAILRIPRSATFPYSEPALRYRWQPLPNPKGATP